MRSCIVEGCDRRHRARGMCEMHYRRSRKKGDPGPVDVIRLAHGIKECAVVGCEEGTSKGAKGYCGLHWARIKRTGSPGVAEAIQAPGRTPEERVYARIVEVQSGCWEWTGAIDTNGYGRVGIGRSVSYVHRWVYEHMVGPIPEGLVLDHLCCNPACCNPEHLDPVTRAVNNARGGEFHGLRAAS